MSMRALARRGVCIVGFVGVCAASAVAGFTTISPPPAGELSHQQILDGVYGAGFSPSGVDFVNAGLGITATRVDDFSVAGSPPAGPLNVATGAPGSATDQVWSDGVATAVAEAKYAVDDQSFGYWPGASGGSYTPLFNVTGNGFLVSGSAVQNFAGTQWRWGRGNNPSGPHSSLPSDNHDGLDHLVTYRITGLSNAFTVWLLFFEDRNIPAFPDGPDSDRDFNDLVVQIRAVPAPIAAGLGLIGLAGVAGRRRRGLA